MSRLNICNKSDRSLSSTFSDAKLRAIGGAPVLRVFFPGASRIRIGAAILGDVMDTLFKSSSNFASLSLKDLVEARDLFHYHLINKKNVVATALGLYRIRVHDPWPSE